MSESGNNNQRALNTNPDALLDPNFFNNYQSKMSESGNNNQRALNIDPYALLDPNFFNNYQYTNPQSRNLGSFTQPPSYSHIWNLNEDINKLLDQQTNPDNMNATTLINPQLNSPFRNNYMQLQPNSPNYTRNTTSVQNSTPNYTRNTTSVQNSQGGFPFGTSTPTGNSMFRGQNNINTPPSASNTGASTLPPSITPSSSPINTNPPSSPYSPPTRNMGNENLNLVTLNNSSFPNAQFKSFSDLQNYVKQIGQLASINNDMNALVQHLNGLNYPQIKNSLLKGQNLTTFIQTLNENNDKKNNLEKNGNNTVGLRPTKYALPSVLNLKPNSK